MSLYERDGLAVLLVIRLVKRNGTLPIVEDTDPDRSEDLSMATINGKPVDSTLYPTVTKGFRYDEVTVPPTFEVEILGAKVERKTVRYKKGQRVACKTWRDFENLRDKAQTYGGEVQFI